MNNELNNTNNSTNSTTGSEGDTTVFVTALIFEALAAASMIAWLLRKKPGRPPLDTYTAISYLLGIVVGYLGSHAVSVAQQKEQITSQQMVLLSIPAFVAGFFGTVGLRYAVPKIFSCVGNSRVCLIEKSRGLFFNAPVNQTAPRIEPRANSLDSNAESITSLPSVTSSVSMATVNTLNIA